MANPVRFKNLCGKRKPKKSEARSLYARAGVQFPGRHIEGGLIHSIHDAGVSVNFEIAIIHVKPGVVLTVGPKGSEHGNTRLYIIIIFANLLAGNGESDPGYNNLRGRAVQKLTAQYGNPHRTLSAEWSG